MLVVGLSVELDKKGSLWSDGEALPTELVGDAGAAEGSLDSPAESADTSSWLADGLEVSVIWSVDSNGGISLGIGALGIGKFEGVGGVGTARLAPTGAFGGEGSAGGAGAPAGVVPFTGGAGAPLGVGALGGASTSVSGPIALKRSSSLRRMTRPTSMSTPRRVRIG